MKKQNEVRRQVLHHTKADSYDLFEKITLMILENYPRIIRQEGICSRKNNLIM